MKTTKIAFFTALLLIVLAGCNNAPPNEDKPQPLSFSESVQSSPESLSLIHHLTLPTSYGV